MYWYRINEVKLKNSFQRKRRSIKSIINLTRAYYSWIEGELGDLKENLGAIEIKYLPQEYSVLFYNLSNLNTNALIKLHTITAILPLSGSQKEKGESYLFGLFEMLSSNENSNKIRFIVYDSKGSGANTLQIAKSIERKNNTSVILGPLTSEEVFSLSGLDINVPVVVPIPAPEGLPNVSKNLYFLSPSKTFGRIKCKNDDLGNGF